MGSERSFRVLCDAIVAGDAERVLHLLTRDPALSRYATTQGATRLDAERFFLAAIARHLTLGDTALHIASASQKPSLVRLFLERGADVCVRNRLGATPLHAAVGGGPTLPHTDGARQAETITLLVQAGAASYGETALIGHAERRWPWRSRQWPTPALADSPLPPTPSSARSPSSTTADSIDRSLPHPYPHPQTRPHTETALEVLYPYSPEEVERLQRCSLTA
jgi:hypothetical protein